MPTKAARGQPLSPCSFTDPLLTTNTAQDKKSTIALGTSPAAGDGWLMCKLACSLGPHIPLQLISTVSLPHRAATASLPATLQLFLIVLIPEYLVTAAGGRYQSLAFASSSSSSQVYPGPVLRTLRHMTCWFNLAIFPN